MPTLLAAAVEKNPDGTAVEFGTRSLTYREIDSRSSRLARLLIERGVGPEDFVALALTRSIESVTAVWAVAKTGAAFVPIDPNYPAARITHMVNDSGVRMGLTATQFEESMPTSVSWISLDSSDTEDALEGLSDEPVVADDRRSQIRPSTLAYVIYTSGSTGLPKGVAVSHAGLAPLSSTQVETFGLDSDSRTLHFASPSFDASVLELLMAVGAGSTMVIVPPGVYGGSDLGDMLRRHRVSHAFITPAALASLDPAEVPDMRVLAIGGEAFTSELMSKWAPGRRFHNVYGPTEASMVCNISPPLNAGEAVLLGPSTKDMGYHVLDDRLRQVPAGVPGELYLTGAGLARGYHRRFSLTAARFVANPYATEGSSDQSRLYRTGDLVRWREVASGRTLEYLGRNDFQVQIRGFRIELGEIDAVLTAQDGVDFAVTLGHRSPTGATVLAAYVLPSAGVDVDLDRVLDEAGRSLPAHMVPSVITRIDSIPLTPTGKLDRDALPEPVFEAAEFRAPSTPTEHVVADIFVELLGTERVGLDDDFFALGGNSLIATQLAARLGSALGVHVPARSVFESSTVEALAQAADSADGPVRAALDTSRQRPERIPLSSAQQRMWFLNRLDTDSALNNVPVALLLRGELDVDALQAAVGDVVGRHETLRTVYPEIDGVGYQQVQDEAEAHVGMDVVRIARDDALAAVTQFFTRGFDVTVEIPFRVRLFHITDPAGAAPEYVLAFVAHHISADGLSMAPLSRDVMTAYLARRGGSAPQWPPLPVQYVDYTLWQLDMLGSESDPKSVARKQIDYWRRTLDGLPEQLDLPSDRPRPRVASGQGAVTAFEIDADLHARVLECAREHDATAFMVVHAALAVLLATLSGTADIAVGAPVGGRGDARLDDLVGMFVNTVVLRTQIAQDAPFGSVLDAVRTSDLEAFDNVDVPFERLVEVLDPVRSQGRHPLVQVALFFQNFSQGSFELPDLGVEAFGSGAASAKFDLQVTLTELGDGAGLVGELMYATDLFDESTVASFGRRLVAVLEAATARPNVVVGDIDVLDSAERERIVLRGNGDEVAVYSGEVLLDGFDRVAADTPDAVAVVFGERSLTYREFSARVDATAQLLQEHSAGPGVLVGLAMRRSVELVVGMYAVLRSGAAYVPVDPDQPTERNDYILDTASPAVVLSTARDEFVTATTVPVVDITDPPEPSESVVFPRASGDDLAYVLFTSGSTGRPKGVAIEHRAIVNQMAWMAQEYGLDASDVYLQKTATTFDVSLWGFFLPLRTGGRLIVAAPGAQRDVEAVAADIARHGVTVTDFVPSMLTVFVEAVSAQAISSLRHVFVIGEALPAGTVDAWRAVSDARVHNLYGPTEAAVSVTYRDVSKDGARSGSGPGSVSIGVPEWNTSVYVLDARLHPVPAGVPGELYLAGVQLARGYVARPDLSAERFVANPFGDAGARMYRTGDLVRWSMDSDRLEYIGRTDFQVKFRGQRIELGEIETALTARSSVSQAVVVVSNSAVGESLAAYLVPTPGIDIDVEVVRAEAVSALPSYMVPSAFVVLDALPLNAAGKLDRRALPAPEFETREFRAPQTPVEEAVAGVFADVLGVERVGLDDDFFALGGNSLIATRVVSRLGSVLGVKVALRALFEAPTVAELAVRATSGVGGGAGVPLTPRERPDSVPLSMAQQRMWFLNRFEPESAAYNLPIVIRLSGRLNVAALEAAARDIVARHETLRTVYPEGSSGPSQVVLPVAESFVWHGVEPTDDVGVMNRVLQIVGEGFDVTSVVPVRVELLRVRPDEFVFVLVVHHISADGSSMAPLARDLMVAYAARAEGEVPSWRPLPVQYIDYTLWQREVLGTESDDSSLMSKQLTFWKDALADAPDQLKLPTDRPRPTVQSYAGARLQFAIDADLHRSLEALGRRHNASLFMVLHAAYVVLLARVAAVDDVVIATPVAGRPDEQLENLVGQFANTLVLRTRVDFGASFDSLLASVKERDLDAFGHADVPFERLVEAISPARSTSHQPLAQVGFSFQNFRRDELVLNGLTIGPVDFEFDTSQYDIHLILSDGYDEHGEGTGVGGVLTYSTDLFDEASVAVLAERFRSVLSSVASDSALPVGDIEVMTDSDRVSMDSGIAGLATPIDPHDTLASLFDEQVAANRDSIAVIYEDTTLTYGEFDAQVNRLARHLTTMGVGPEVLVGLHIRRSVELLVAMYAVTKAGGGYVPLDPDQPVDRSNYVLDTAGVVVVLTTTRDVLPQSMSTGRTVVPVDVVDLTTYSSAPVRADERRGALTAGSTAYVIFTSGSTGRPKGVVIEHRAIVNQLLWKRDCFGLGTGDVSIIKTVATFDLSVWEFWSSLTSGGAVVLASNDSYRDPAYLLELMARHSVTTVHAVPSMLSALTASGNVPARRVLAIGEALPVEVAASVDRSESVEVYNLYGPTEAAVSVTFHKVLGSDSDVVPIGRPEWNTSAYVLDSRLHPVPAGVPGELYLAGVQLARGYVSRPDLSSERFVADPFGSAGSRMYRTGDVVSRRNDGELVFIGRTDDQVKVRGFRIELGEIDHALRTLAGVSDCAVVVRDSGRSGEQIVAYVVGGSGDVLDTADLRARLSALVPSYMVPAGFVVLDSLPLTVNGKLDRRALPDPVFEPRVFRAPSTPEELAVAAAFADVLGIERVGLDDDFFSLGGNSLLAVTLVSRLRAELDGGPIPLTWVFVDSSVSALAARVAERGAHESRGTELSGLEILIPLRVGGSSAPLFCIHPIVGLSWAFGALAAHVGDDRPIYGLQSPALSGTEPMPQSLEQWAALFVDKIRTVQPFGPYHLLGWSMGGAIAHAMAVRLQREGQEVSTLALMDSFVAGNTDHVVDRPVSVDEMLGGLGIATDDQLEIGGLTVDSVAELLKTMPAPFDSISRERVAEILDGIAHSAELLDSYVPQTFTGRALLFASVTDDPTGEAAAASWHGALGEGVTVVPVHSTHWQMASSPALTEIGPVLDAELRR
ncbi:amino acid adenylation domain-containing protein [Rhodococcus sp. 1R11]|nr:amino acid adenylation domain-containing protein [Rhodococcus sp. 1R11]